MSNDESQNVRTIRCAHARANKDNPERERLGGIAFPKRRAKALFGELLASVYTSSPYKKSLHHSVGTAFALTDGFASFNLSRFRGPSVLPSVGFARS